MRGNFGQTLAATEPYRYKHTVLYRKVNEKIGHPVKSSLDGHLW